MVKRTGTPEPDIAAVASLIGEPGRAAMLLALLDGRELTASELALRAGTSPQAGTAHLKVLVAGSLLTVRAQGRNRLFRLASAEIGDALESLAAIAPALRITSLSQSTALDRLRAARSCYDHLAGRLGVAVTDALVAREALTAQGSGFTPGSRAEHVFFELGVDLADARAARRAFARGCLDWTERRPHLAGSLGAAVMARFLTAGWITRISGERTLRITERGRTDLQTQLGITL